MNRTVGRASCPPFNNPTDGCSRSCWGAGEAGRMPALRCLAAALLALMLLGSIPVRGAEPRIRLLIETDAGGDPDDEQSLVRFLLYANEWDIEGIIANRPGARDGENRNPVRTGLGIVRRLLDAYGDCWTNLVQHDGRYP